MLTVAFKTQEMKHDIFTEEFFKEIGFTLTEKKKVSLNLIQFMVKHKTE